MSFVTKVKTRAGKEAYAVRWTDGGGKVKQRQFPFASDARKFAAQKEIEQNPQQTTREQRQAWSVAFGRDGPSFRALQDEWLDSKTTPTDGSEPLEASTLRAYRKYLANISDVIGDEKIARIDAAHFERVLEARREKGNATSTIKLHLNLVTNVLEYAKERRIIQEVPTHSIKLTKGRRERIVAKRDQDEKPYSPNEIYTMLAAADSLGADPNKWIARVWRRYRPMIYFLAYTGCRVSEARAWRWGDYFPDDNRIRIHQKAGDGTDVGEVKAVASVRKLPLHGPLKVVLETMESGSKDALVFTTSSVKPPEWGACILPHYRSSDRECIYQSVCIILK